MSTDPVSVERAQALLAEHARVLPSERLNVRDAHRRVAASSLRANWSLPQWRLSKMDGYALGEPGPDPSRYHVIGESSAGHPFATAPGPGECLRVSTGAVVPDATVAVVPQERTTREDEVIHLDPAWAPVMPGRFIRNVASDLAKGRCLARPGQVLEAPHLALLAATGHDSVQVVRRPRVAILCTGSELVEPGTPLAPGQIVATNGMVMRWQCEQAHAQIVGELHVEDSRESTRDALAHLSQRCDVLLTCGGISVGPHDHVLASLQALGWTQLFRKTKLAPGRPTTAGILDETLIIALPGNPASCYVTFELFVRPILLQLSGRHPADCLRPQRWVHCDHPPKVEPDRDRYLRARVQGGAAELLTQQQSGDLSSLWGHNALVRIPAASSGGPHLALLLCESNFEPPLSTPPS